MKCIACGARTRYRDLSGDRRCTCGESFAFVRREGDRLPDPAFEAAIQRVSAGGTLRWGIEHLYFDVCRQLRRRGNSLFIRPSTRRMVAIDRTAFDALWLRWTTAHGAPPTFVGHAARWRGSGVKISPMPEDVTGYSFERAVVTDSAATLGLLLANNFHVDSRCAVVRFDGPSGVFAKVVKMLRRSSRLHVLAVHDATPSDSGSLSS